MNLQALVIYTQFNANPKYNIITESMIIGAYEDTSAAYGNPRAKQFSAQTCDVSPCGNDTFHPSITGYIQEFSKQPKWCLDKFPGTVPR